MLQYRLMWSGSSTTFHNYWTFSRIVGLCSCNPSKVSGDSGVHASIIRISTTIAPACDTNLNSANEKRTTTVTLKSAKNRFNEDWNIYYYSTWNITNWNTDLASVCTRCGSAQHISSDEKTTILTSADSVVLYFDVGLQQYNWNAPSYRFDYKLIIFKIHTSM